MAAPAGVAQLAAIVASPTDHTSIFSKGTIVSISGRNGEGVDQARHDHGAGQELRAFTPELPVFVVSPTQEPAGFSAGAQMLRSGGELDCIF